MWQPCEGFFVQDIEHRAAKKLQVIRKQSKLMSRNLQHLQCGICWARPSLHLPYMKTIP